MDALLQPHPPLSHKQISNSTPMPGVGRGAPMPSLMKARICFPVAGLSIIGPLWPPEATLRLNFRYLG